MNGFKRDMDAAVAAFKRTLDTAKANGRISERGLHTSVDEHPNWGPSIKRQYVYAGAVSVRSRRYIDIKDI